MVHADSYLVAALYTFLTATYYSSYCQTDFRFSVSFTLFPTASQSSVILMIKAVNREDKRSRRYRDRDFAKFERSRRYRDRCRC